MIVPTYVVPTYVVPIEVVPVSAILMQIGIGAPCKDIEVATDDKNFAADLIKLDRDNLR
jgi:hypothetical protein